MHNTIRNLKSSVRGLQNKADFMWNSFLTKTTYALGRLRFPKNKRKSKFPLERLNVISITSHQEAAAIGLVLPQNYKELMKGLYDDALARMEDPRNCLLRSADENVSKKLSNTASITQSTWEIPEVKNGLVGTVHLRNTLDLKGLDELSRFLLPQIESTIYESPVVVERANVFRRLPSTLPEFSSILWHSDNHYKGVVKIMFYLNDVGSEQAPFEYLRHAKTHEPIHVEPNMPQFYPKGRVPQEVIEKYKKEGYEAHKVLGPANTMLIFDDKVIHKGNYSEKGIRDVLVLQLRPVAKPRSSYIDPRWTFAI